MNLKQSALMRYCMIGGLGRFVVSVCVLAAWNNAEIIFQTMSAASAAGTRTGDGYEITVCYFGPPASFYPRLLVLVAMLVATVGVFKRTRPGNTIVVVGLIGALGVYIHWWTDSYRVFQNFQDVGIPFLDHAEIQQVAYLYQGTESDICVALSIVVCLVLVLDRFLTN